MDVFWLEQTEGDVPAENQWLSRRERSCIEGMRFAKRRADWRLGRWTAKRALAACLDRPANLHALANMEILAAPSGAPEALLLDRKMPISISLSHRAGTAMCTVALSGATLGCDLEMVEPRSAAFIADYFTVNEQRLVERTPVAERPLLVTLLWSAKESALKALQAGLRLDTNCVDVALISAASPRTRQCLPESSLVSQLTPDANGWCPLHIRYCNGQIFHGWWRHAAGMVRTVASQWPLHLEGIQNEGIQNRKTQNAA